MPAGRRPAAAAVAVVLVLAGCTNRESPLQKRPNSGSATASTVAGVQQIDLDAGADMRFHPSIITAHPGMIRVVLHNTEKTGEGAPHNFSLVRFPGDNTPDALAGQTTSVTFRAPTAGRYRFVCTFHAKLGQIGTLVVTR